MSGEEGMAILYVGTDTRLAADLEAELGKRREDVEVKTADCEGALERLTHGNIDCLVIECDLPERDGVEFLNTVRERWSEVPVVVVTDSGSERLASEAIASGADDYVPSEESDGTRLLADRVETHLEQYCEEANYREVFEKAGVALSVRDPETGAFVDANEQYCELMGYDPVEIPSLTGDDVGVNEPPYTTDRAHELLWETIEEGPQTVEWVNERRDGTELRVEATLKPAMIRGRQCVLVSVRDITEQWHREEALERTNDLLRATQELANVGGWELNPSEDTLRWTDEVRRIHDVPLDFNPDLETAIEFYHPDDRGTVRKAVEGAVEAGEPFDFEARIVTQSRETRWVQALGGVHSEAGNRIVRGAVQDITDRKRHERRLRELQHATRDLIRAPTPQAVADIAVRTAEEALELPLSGVHIVNSEEVLRGISGTEAVRERFGKIPDYGRESDTVSELLWEVFETGETLVIDDTAANEAFGARERPVGSGIVHPLGDHGVFITSSPEPNGFDEADRAFAEMLATATTAALDRVIQQRRYEAIFNRTFQLTGLVEPDGTLIEANDTALDFIGADREDVLGIPLWETPWFQYDDESRRIARKSVEQARTGEFFRDEATIVGADGTMIIDYSVQPVTDENGDVILLVPEGRDITERKEREAELERKNQQLEEFASVVSHDLRNPLSVATGHLELASRECDSDSLDLVAEAHDRMAALIEDLLTLAREGDPVDIVETVDLGGSPEPPGRLSRPTTQPCVSSRR